MEALGSPELEALVRRLRGSGSVFAEDEAHLLVREAVDREALEVMVQRRTAGQPLEQILGFAEFRGRRITLLPGVFVPRRRTELLADVAEAAVQQLTAAGPTQPRPQPSTPVVVELCCGAAAVSAVLAAAQPDVEVYAVDIDPTAVACARQNLRAADTALQGDLYTALPERLRGRVDVLVANAPYVPTGSLAAMPPEARLHEPRVALDGGRDGLDVLRRVVQEAAHWLSVLGCLVVEAERSQLPVLERLLRDGDLQPTPVTATELDATAVIGTCRSNAGSWLVRRLEETQARTAPKAWTVV